MKRLGLLFLLLAVPARALELDPSGSAAFRSWFVRIAREQVSQGPSPRWKQHDCAGLVRFAAQEALKTHDAKWLRANGMTNRFLPPEIPGRHGAFSWHLPGGRRGAFADALELVQANTRFVSRDVNQAVPGDLLFFDQGEDQHLMIWMDGSVAYHTGHASPGDNGLRLVEASRLLHWKDTRWQPTLENPNFAGVYRFAFLSR